MVDALRCATEWQTGMADRNADRADNRLEFRIGINVGDVVGAGWEQNLDGNRTRHTVTRFSTKRAYTQLRKLSQLRPGFE